MKMFRLPILSLFCALAPVVAGAQQQWRMQYFYDQAKSFLEIADIQFPSPNRGIAVGTIREGSKQKQVAVTSNDGGATWAQSPLEDEPISLFFLNDSLGWLVTEKGLWQTTEGGRDWRKIGKPPSPVLRVYFWDENHGIAACMKKTVLETFDGGKKWTPVKDAATPAGAPERSAYTWIAFGNPKYGIVTGYNQPLSRWTPMFATWLDPAEALSRRETAHLGYTLSTTDGGKTWTSSSQSILGHVTRIRLRGDGLGMGLVEHADSFRYPSEVYKLDWRTGKSETVFRDKKYAITDVWLARDGSYYLGGLELQGTVRSVAPGRVRVFHSTDLKGWDEMKVDYRASAQRVVFAGAGDDLWLATDNGMILKLK
ncbi:MAG TPA: hypothetical protein VNV86_11020 [Candidatus Acidoferrum sp.]|nr:hypothetical protein [Candidatus Acidoferrum sp.]